MPVFSYVALNNGGQALKGTMEQAERSAVIQALTSQGLKPVSIKETAKKTTTSTTAVNKYMGKNKVKTDHLVLFTRQLSAMIAAGVPLLRALTALAEHIADDPVLRNVLSGIIKDIEAGSTFGDALSRYPNTFNDIYVNMVRAGEAAGILDDILGRLAIQQEKSMAMRKKVKSAMAYPISLLVVTIAAFFGLMIFIVPQIGSIVKSLGGEDATLPWITVFMLGVSDFIIHYWYILIGVAAGTIFGIVTYIRTPKGRFNYHSILLKIPVAKTLVTKVVVARFARTFSALMEAGVAVLEAIRITSRAVGNSVFEKYLLQAEEEVKNGKNFSAVIAAYSIFPAIVSQMLLVGEETGQTDKIIVKIADFYEEEVDDSISGLSSIIEPAMIVIMGGMVGLIAASVMLPIANLSQSIK